MYIEKLKVMNMISDRIKHDNTQLELIEVKDRSNNILENLKYFFPHLMFYLWENPQKMALILQNADITDVKNYLANFIVNNFYENILSPNFIEENLIYVLTLLLHEEINSLLYAEQHSLFLDDTCSGYLLEELRKKKDIQTFFKNVITESIENLEINYSNFKFNFDIEKMNSNYLEETKNRITIENIYLRSNFKEKDIIKRMDKKTEENTSEKIMFNLKYMPLLDKQSLEKYAKENNIDTKNSLYELYSSHINNVSPNDPFLYSNEQLFSYLEKYRDSEMLLYLYQKNFIGITKFITLILDKIINNFNVLPYSIKTFCKIISLMIEQKFPDITQSEKNIFLAKFFFGRLLIPILRNPGTEAFINSIILSENTLNNLQVICDIINKFVSGELYTSENGEFTPFNWYFIEQSEKIYKIFEYATNVSLPSFIEDYLNNKLPDDFKYDYFQQNKDELINFRSICFNMHEALSLINSLDRCKSEIFVNSDNDTDTAKKAFEKLISKSSKNIMNEIFKKQKESIDIEMQSGRENMRSDDIGFLLDDFIVISQEKKIEKEIPKEKRTIYYFLLTSLITSDSYKKLFEISQPTKSFSIKEIKETTNEESVKKNNIIKVKNFICSLLYNFDKLVENNFNRDKVGSTEKILDELNILMKSAYFVIDGTIPFDWYINSIYEYLKKIPDYLTKNDCEKLYKEIEQDVNNSLEELDFIKLSVILEKLEFAERGKIFYKENQKFLMDIKLKEQAKEIVYNEFIPVSIKFSWKENNGIFEIEPVNFFKIEDKNNLDNINNYQNANNKIIALTIDDFTKKFPDLLMYQDYQDTDIFMLQEKLNFSQKLENYFKIILRYIKSNNKYIQNEFKDNINQIMEIIFDFVMDRIYDKIFPVEANKNDCKIHQNSIKLSWVKPSHFLDDKKQYVFGNIINDINYYLKLLMSEKSTRKKLINLDEIINNITFFYKFNDKNDIGVDAILPVLVFAFIKAQPPRLDSNIKYVKIYRKLGKFFAEGNKFEIFEAAIALILDPKFENFKAIAKEEFNENMKNESNTIK